MYWSWILISGLLIGTLSRVIRPGKDPGGFLFTQLLSVSGAFIVNLLTAILGWYSSKFSYVFLLSIFGAGFFIGLYEIFGRDQLIKH